jgi:penicillin-binding protein 1A
MPDDSQRVISERNAFIMSQLLNEITRTGTASRAQTRLARPDVYGKTGTTNDAVDAWFVGFHPTLTAAVWLGYDTPRNLGLQATGSSLALPIWIDFMALALNNIPINEKPIPEGVVFTAGEWFYQEFRPGLGIKSIGVTEPTQQEFNPIPGFVQP